MLWATRRWDRLFFTIMLPWFVAESAIISRDSSFPLQVTVVQTYPQLLNYNATALNFYIQQCVPVFVAAETRTNSSSRSSLCGYNIDLTYPQSGGHFPPLEDRPPTAPGRMLENLFAAKPAKQALLNTERLTWGQRKRALSMPRSRALHAGADVDDTVDPWYGCLFNRTPVDASCAV